MLKWTQTEPTSFTIAKIDLLASISKISWDSMPNFKKTKKSVKDTNVTPPKKVEKEKCQNEQNLKSLNKNSW